MRFILFLAAGAALLTGGCDRQTASQSQAEAVTEAGRPGAPGLDRSQAGKPIPDIIVRDPLGEEIALAAVTGGRPTLVNLWATWCAPCVKELPTLAALSRRPGAPRVVALSQDMQSQDKVAAFLEERKLSLEPFQDAEMAMSSAMGVQILPTTILYGADGREIWRYTGDLDWAGAKAAELLKNVTSGS